MPLIQPSNWETPRIAQIMVDYKLISLGYFKSEIEAAKTYNQAAKEYHGEFAALNEINGEII